MASEATTALRFASPVSMWSAAAAPAGNCLKSSSGSGLVLKKVCVETPRKCRPQQQGHGEGHALHQSDPNKELAFHGFVNLFSVSGMEKFRHMSVLRNAQRRSQRSFSGKVYATAVIIKGTETYQLPTWAEFEMGAKPVFWETQTGLPPASGEMLTIYFNPAASQLVPRTEYGIGFNGGFNQPIMCGGEPRIMTKRERGAVCEPFYIMKINVPVHALSLEFSFTDGTSWDGPYKLKFEIPAKWRNQPVSFFNEGLADILSREGACESAIFPEPTFVQDRCSFPANLTIEGGDRCELDLVPGCTDPENPFYNPLANVEDGSCPYISDSDSE